MTVEEMRIVLEKLDPDLKIFCGYEMDSLFESNSVKDIVILKSYENSEIDGVYLRTD